jgi:hypothetical protein
MSDLGPLKIKGNYQRLLQKTENGMVADGSGSVVTLNLSGSEYYTSGSDNATVLKALTVTGSIIPEGSGSWDLGSEDSPFRDLYVTEESIKMISTQYGKDDSRRVVHLKASDVSDWQKGKFDTKIDSTTGKRLSTPIASSIQTIITEPFEFDRDRDLYPVDVTASDTVQDTYWANDRENLYLKSTRFGIAGVNTDDIEIV